jgi:PAS domain S-box-containing protein
MSGNLADFLIRDPTERPRPAVLGFALALAAGILALRLKVEDVGEPILLLNIIPISIVAIELGAHGGMAAATAAIALLGAWSVEADAGYTPLAFVVRLIAFVVAGGLVGHLFDRLQLTREALRRLFDSSPMPAVGLGLDGEIRSVNACTLALFGARREEMIGARIERFLPGFFSELRERARREGAATAFRLSGRSDAGATFPLDVSVTPWQAEEGVLLVRLET